MHIQNNGLNLINKNTKVRSFKSSQYIQKKECGSDCTVSNNKFSSVAVNELAMKARKKTYRNFECQQGSQSKDRYKSKMGSK